MDIDWRKCSMKIIFTICSNNYLAQAKTLGDSIMKYNQDYKFIICLCDRKKNDLNYSSFEPYEIIEAHKIGIENFSDMCRRYDIVELNTSVKPFMFDYIYKNFDDAQYVMYFDPDTYVFDKLTSVEDELNDCAILLTPHIYTPIEFDGESPTENLFTRHGLYNLGFLATKKSENTNEILNWWMRRLEINCYDNANEGIFVDQLPMNYAPIFFKGVKISQNWGLNMAPWNLQERNLTISDHKYSVNNKYPLIFYHFSNCNPLATDLLSTYYTRVTFKGNEILKKAYDEYKSEVLNNNYESFTLIKCAYNKGTSKRPQMKKTSTLLKTLKYLKKYPLFIFRKDFWI